jgi:hypothetical protein
MIEYFEVQSVLHFQRGRPAGHRLPILPSDVHYPEVAVTLHPVALARRRIDQRHRKTGGEWTKARINNIGRAANRHGNKHMTPLRFGQWPEQNDPRGMTGDPKTERFKHGSEQSGVLKTITAAVGTDHLTLKTVKIETHRSAKQHVQVLKGDMCGVGLNQPRQILKRRGAVTGPMNALEIGVEINRGGHGFPPVKTLQCYAASTCGETPLPAPTKSPSAKPSVCD